MTSGVPQGTVLGPLLFLIYINDLPNGLISFVSLFADDLKIVADVRKNAQTNEDLKMLDEWQQLWKIRFNTSDQKCKVLHVGNKNQHNKYYLDGELLPTVELEKDLGLFVDDHLNWERQIQKSTSKAKQVIGWVRRNVITRSPNVMITIYKSLIRPHLEYCVQVWNLPAQHGNWKHIMDIEKVQRDFTRLVEGVGLLTYEERLKQLNLTTLIERRMRGDIIETYKILSGQADYGKHMYRISRSGMKLLYTGKPGRFRDAFLPNRVLKYWNKIPDIVKESVTTTVFKTRLENFKKHNEEVKGNYWELSTELLNRIKQDEVTRNSYVNFMQNNPDIAKRRGITV